MTFPRVLAAALFALALPALADGEFPGVKALMDEEQFKSTGLGKLSAEELEALDAWLLLYTAGEAAELRRTNEEVKEVEMQYEVVARIKEPFDGWEGSTQFFLDNGQVWKQRLPGRYRYPKDNNEVLIKKNFMGYYVMTLKETGKAIGVTRVR